MSYAKMMKWNKTHRKGISYKRGWVGFDHSTPGKRNHSSAFMDDYFEFKAEWEAKGVKAPTMDEYYDYNRSCKELLRFTDSFDLYEIASRWEDCTKINHRVLADVGETVFSAISISQVGSRIFAAIPEHCKTRVTESILNMSGTNFLPKRTILSK